MKLDDARRVRDQLTDAARPAVDLFLLDHPHVRDGSVTPAVRTSVTLRAGLAYLVGWGLIAPLRHDQWPPVLEMTIPTSLEPPTRR